MEDRGGWYSGCMQRENFSCAQGNRGASKALQGSSSPSLSSLAELEVGGGDKPQEAWLGYPASFAGNLAVGQERARRVRGYLGCSVCGTSHEY